MCAVDATPYRRGGGGVDTDQSPRPCLLEEFGLLYVSYCIEGTHFEQNVAELGPRADAETVTHDGCGCCGYFNARVVSLGLSRDLAESGPGSSGSLGATVPVSTRGIAPAQTSRNQFVVCGVDLHTDVADPIERVHRIHNSAVEAITAAKSPGHMMIFGALASVPGFIFTRSVGVIERRQHRHPVASFHTGISSVPRGEGDWRLGDAKTVGCFGVISLEGIAGVGHTIDTLGDLATINITVDPDLFADTDRYRELLANAWNDIRTAAAALGVNSVVPSR